MHVMDFVAPRAGDVRCDESRSSIGPNAHPAPVAVGDLAHHLAIEHHDLLGNLFTLTREDFALLSQTRRPL